MKKLACLILFGALSASPALADPDPAEIVRDAIDNWRGTSSYIEQTMIVHRPEWERSSAVETRTLSFASQRRHAMKAMQR